jgi:NADH-quinone oxidoreductase subunit A
MRYYIIAMLFVIFDIETVFIFPWAVIFKQLGLFALVEMLVFIAILLVGYFYAWKKGALEWD